MFITFMSEYFVSEGIKCEYNYSETQHVLLIWRMFQRKCSAGYSRDTAFKYTDSIYILNQDAQSDGCLFEREDLDSGLQVT